MRDGFNDGSDDIIKIATDEDDDGDGIEINPPEMVESDGEEWEPHSSSFNPLAKIRKEREDRMKAQEELLNS